MLTAQSEFRPLLSKSWDDFNEIFRTALQWYKEQLIKFWGDLGCLSGSPNRETKQYGGNEQPWPRRSALSESSCSPMCYPQGIVYTCVWSIWGHFIACIGISQLAVYAYIWHLMVRPPSTPSFHLPSPTKTFWACSMKQNKTKKRSQPRRQQYDKKQLYYIYCSLSTLIHSSGTHYMIRCPIPISPSIHMHVKFSAAADHLSLSIETMPLESGSLNFQPLTSQRSHNCDPHSFSSVYVYVLYSNNSQTETIWSQSF